MISAVLEAGRLRFRPILLTSATTMLGLSPLTFFVSGDARFLQPMAISIFYGLGAASRASARIARQKHKNTYVFPPNT